MPTANGEIQRILREKDAGIRSGVVAIRDLLEELSAQIQSELGMASLNSWNSFYLKQLLNTVKGHVQEYNSRARAEVSGMLDASWQKGYDLVDVPLMVAGIYSGFGISSSSLEVLKDFTFHKISGLSTDAFDKVKSELTLGVLGGKTPQEVSKAIGKNLTEPSIFTSIGRRAEAITKTELGRVFSMAAQERMEGAAEYVEGLEKQWLHSGHPKVARPMHLNLHGFHVPVNEPFLVGSTPMMYPRDPGAPASQVINCGCVHVPYLESWDEAA